MWITGEIELGRRCSKVDELGLTRWKEEVPLRLSLRKIPALR